MRRTRTLGAALAATLAVTALVAGCSDDSDSGSTGGSTSAAKFDPSTVAKDDTLAAAVPDAIKSKGTLTVGSDTTYAPAEYIGDDGKTAVGYDVDIAKAIAATLGLKVDVQTASFDSIIPSIGSRYDIGISSFTINPDREKQVNMVQYFQAGEAFAVAKGNPKNIDTTDLCGKTVGVQTGTVEDDELGDLSKKCTDAGKPAIDALKYKSQADVTTNLVGGKADVMYADSPIIAYAISQTGGQLEQAGDVIATAPQGIVVSKDDQALTTVIQKTVQKLIDDGDYVKILTAWGNEVGAVQSADVNPAVAE
ncbi:ABC transporter substrate-binding protein [Luteimicrobium subarcticum]|uniref:Amino acid ABC transporter substrate-binding protein (PAAT family) n=1 Tax=Luteimicrobium subarcticum TaxID=620910 RepID=A0A2M8WJ71_9MICO|nr:ABC transporter substrate-binding protein [Luteimicrobium subarcticum]PJI90972.1 amino acid ABC transporter substrate-binding protein (PAAT family) [Luteimicrobium subarcticum]